MTDTKNLSLNVLNSLGNFKLLSPRLKIVVEILIVYNARISEILLADYKNFYPHQFLILDGLKKSENVIIRDRILLEEIQQLKPNGSALIFYPLKYKFVYDFIKRNYSHLFNRIKTSKTKKVTHAFRYLNVQPLADDNNIKLILHHRSQRSGIYYKNKVKDKC